MEVDENGAAVVGKKIILKRHRNNVNENLNRLELATMKKKIAQDLYYRNKPIGQSPMFKPPSDKTSVHQRLGTNNNGNEKKTVLLNRSRFRWKGFAREGIVTRKYRNGFGANNAQKRLERLRNNFVLNKGLVRLRRNNNAFAADNIRVQVSNRPQRHSVHNSVDRAIQARIGRLQQKLTTLHHIPDVPITCTEFGYTRIPLNVRFSGLP